MSPEERQALCGLLRANNAAIAADEIERLAALAQSDASAGLIEAAEIAEKEANNWGTGGITLREFAVKLRAVAAVRNNPEAFAKLKAIRARAADRSGK